MRVPAVLLSIALLGACTTVSESGGSVDAPTTTTSTTLAPRAAVEEFRACMHDAGWEVPAFDATGSTSLASALGDIDPSEPERRRALASCSVILWSAGILDLSSDPELREAVIERLSDYARCMRAGGVTTFPDPDPGFTGAGPAFPVDRIPYAHPAFPQAAAACADVVSSVPGAPPGE